MISLFRKLRQQLLSKSRFSKYLIYAIGEIILVVFGILIALQINNASENRKNRSFELKVLIELKSDLTSNLEELSQIRRDYEGFMSKSDSLTELLESGSFDPVLNSKLLYGLDRGKFGVFNVSNTTYKFIENKGFELLSNDSTRIAITDMYERRIYNVKNIETILFDFFRDHTRPYMMKQFELPKSGIPLVRDVTVFKDHEFINIVNTRARLMVAYGIISNNCKKHLESLIENLEHEIRRLKEYLT